jgi:exodeoxyribonuclease-3
MRIATWNVNSIRSRIDRVEALLQRHEIDVLALQETKAREDQIPLMGLQSLGYDVAAAGYNQWNGVAVISRVGIEDVTVGLPRDAGMGRARGSRRGAGNRRELRWSADLVALRPQRPQGR